MMNTSKFGFGQVKEEVAHNNFNEASQIDAVKNEPREIDIITSASSCNIASTGETDFVDRKCATDTDDHQEHNEKKLEHKPEENLDGKNLIPKDTTVGIKNDNIDIFYEDIKRETCDEKLIKLVRFCDVCHQSIGGETELLKSTSFRPECSCQKQNMSLHYIDVKPFSLELATDSVLKSTAVQDETISGDELAKEKEQYSSAAPRRLLVPPMLNDNKMKLKFSSEPLEINLPVAEKKIQCKICSKSFNQMGTLKIHERSHTGEKPFSCGICLKAFINSSQLTVHGRVHTGEKPFHCETCSKSFSQMITLKIHVRSHTGEKPYHCKICSKTFSNLSGLRVHGKRVHTVEKPFQCKICSEYFSRMDTLKVHERGHTGEKLFRCQICSKEFINSRGLRIHGKIHTGEKPFQCDICSKSFKRRETLENHERGHTGEKPFCCNICFKRFSYSRGLRVHEKIHAREIL